MEHDTASEKKMQRDVDKTDTICLKMFHVGSLLMKMDFIPHTMHAN